MINQTIITVEELSASLKHFNLFDYAACMLMLVICGGIGVYFGFLEKKNLKSKGNEKNIRRYESTEELDYLVGGRKMKTLPIAISLIASWVSGIALLGTSTEVYIYGVNYLYMVVALAISSIASWHLYLPVFHELQLTSTYEYLELRFSKGVRRFGSVMFCINMMLWLPIVIFVPALALNQIAGISIHIISPIVCGVCIFYTCVGGIKAVVWTDVLQAVIMLAAIIAVMVKGTIEVGGFDVVWERNLESGRLDVPPATFDPTIRYSLFSIFGGGCIYWVQSTTTNQTMMQRYSSLPTTRSARKALAIFVIGLGILLAFCVYNGLLLYATYFDCDPITTKLAAAKDQMIPLIVMEQLGHIPGMPGFFIAGVLCAALSSLSTGLNSLTAVILEDFWKPMMSRPMSERQIAIVMRLIVVVFGLYCIGMVFVVEKLGSVLQLSGTMGAISMGPECGLYMIGLFLPWINKKSALTGGITSLLIMGYVCLRCQLSVASGEFTWPEKPFRTDGCTYNFTIPANKTLHEQDPNGFHPISHLLFITIGSSITVVVAVISSFLYGRLDPRDVDSKLLAPFVRKFIKSRKYLSVQPDIKERESIIHGYEMPSRNVNGNDS